jgi:hypothetical protein
LRHPDLTPLMQVLLLGSIGILTATALVRFGLFFRNQFAGRPYRYPDTWTAEQAKTFALLRLAIAGCVGISWLTLLAAQPQLPVSWPFGLEEALFTIGLLLLTNGWLALLVRWNWENSALCRFRFRTGFAIVALWWIAVFTALYVALGWAMTPHVHFVIPQGTIA